MADAGTIVVNAHPMTLDDHGANGGITADLVDRGANYGIAEVNACDNHHPHCAPIFEENLKEALTVKKGPHALLNDVVNAEANIAEDHADPDVPPEPPPGLIETILKMTVPSDNGKKLIREYADTSDAQQAFVVVEHLKSTKAQLNAPRLLAYLATAKLAACNRNDSYEFFILQRQEHVRICQRQMSRPRCTSVCSISQEENTEIFIYGRDHQEPLSRRHRVYQGSHWSFTVERSENGETVENVITNIIQQTTSLSALINLCSTLRYSKDPLVHEETVMSGDNEVVSNSSMPTESMQTHCGMGRLGQFSCRSYSSDVGYYRLLIWHRSSYRFGTKGSDKINTRFSGRDSYPPTNGNRLHS
jgi:hypothetical protein